MRTTVASLAVGICLWAANAQAIGISTSVGNFDVVGFDGAFTGNEPLLVSQPWWGNELLADEFGLLVADGLGVVVSFAKDEGQRFSCRELLTPLVEVAVARCSVAELALIFDAKGVCWQPYRTLRTAMTEEPRLVTGNPLFSDVRHPRGWRYPTPGPAATLMRNERLDAKGHRCDIEAGMAKLLAARVAWSNADASLQIHGGNGYAQEYEISRVLCDARILNIFEGAAEIQAQVVGRGLLARGPRQPGRAVTG